MSLTVVAPAYMKRDCLAEFLDRTTTALENQNVEFEIIVVIDGDQDLSSIVVNSFRARDARIRGIVHSENLGKGAAIRTGALAANHSKYLAYFDADLDINAKSLLAYIDFLEKNPNIDILYASKLHRDSEVNYPLLRRVLSKVLQFIVRLSLNIDVNDTQTGLKVGRTDAMKKAILKTETNGFAFDLEFFVNASRNRCAFASMPVHLDFQFNSTISISHIFQILTDLLRIRTKINRDKVEKSVGIL
jgi:glycosyltransferase involved in cell wall biosynthesis